MNHHTRDMPVNRLEDLLRRRRPRPAHRAPRGEALRPSDPLHTPALDRPGWRAIEPEPVPLLEGAEYRYRHGSHRLVLAIRGVTAEHEAAVGRGEAEFALAVEGPLLIFRYRFGEAIPWSSAAPYNWHFTPEPERVVPAAIEPTPETYARLWSTLWITLVDADDGRVCARRAAALRPEFTHALHGVLRAQALQPFHGAAADRALDRVRYATAPSVTRALATTSCAAVWVPEMEGPPYPGRHDRIRALRMRH